MGEPAWTEQQQLVSKGDELANAGRTMHHRREGRELVILDGYSPKARTYWLANRPGLENPYLAATSATEIDLSDRMIA